VNILFSSLVLALRAAMISSAGESGYKGTNFSPNRQHHLPLLFVKNARKKDVPHNEAHWESGTI